jgi:GT2 family glycosyltransferase
MELKPLAHGDFEPPTESMKRHSLEQLFEASGHKTYSAMEGKKGPQKDSMKCPLVSVVIPARNRHKAVESSLDALAAQTLPPSSFEVLVVDDGCVPPLALDRERWAGKFDLKLLHQQNTGPAGARNRGVAEARGEFLAFTNDDCLPTPTWLEKLVAALREQSEALVGGSTFNGLKDDLFAETSQLILEMVYEHFNRDPANAYFFASNNIACRKQEFVDCGGFDASFRVASEDREFCDRWRMAGQRLLWIRDAVIEHRHAQSFPRFTRLHFRYGQGARLYQQIRKHRNSGFIDKDLNFHRHIPRMVWKRRQRFPRARFLVFLFLLLWWEAVNAVGFSLCPPACNTNKQTK